MSPDDLDAVGRATEAGGFGNRRAFFETALSRADCRPMIAVEGERIVATGVGAIHGSVGWIGVIFVSPDLRGRGLGTAITVAVCDTMRAAGCESLVLVATDLGRPIYARLGFRVSSEYHMFSGDSKELEPAPPPGATLRRVTAADLDRIADLDQLATGEDRRPLIEAFAGSGWLLEDEAQAGGRAASDAASEPLLRGFLLPTTRGNAALVAPDPADAVCLLDMHRRLGPTGGHVWAGLLTENVTGRELLAERGWFAWRTFPRMVLGPDPDVNPEMIWAQFNHTEG
jgi:GNAT superfamily N-acetyltransferase